MADDQNPEQKQPEQAKPEQAKPEPGQEKPAVETKPVAAKKPVVKKKKQKTVVDTARQTRRRFVMSSVFGFIAICLAATARFFFPRVLYEPKTRFTVGYPADFALGVDTRFQASNRVWVVRDSSSIYVILARCTHLGCTPDWKEADNKFKCPCHGSGFDMEGVNFEGPAPRPLQRTFVELDSQGKLVVDIAILYEADQWKEVGSFVAMS